MKRITFLLFLLSFILCIYPTMTLAHNDRSHSGEITTRVVSTKKVWNIHFNTPLDPNTVNGKTIYVTDSSGNHLNTHAEIHSTSKGQTIIVHPPIDDYEPNQSYTLHISNKVKSVKGVPIAGEQSLPFHTKTATEYTLIAKEGIHQVTSKSKLDIWGYNGTTPGPILRVKEGEILRVNLGNKLKEPVTIHWHGIPLRNSMDGVPGLTQNAVQPGSIFTYEFITNHPGTYIYHSHQESAKQVDRGLYGALIVEEKQPSYDKDFVLIFDRFGINGKVGDLLPKLSVKDGDKIRLRMINIGTATYDAYLNGVDYKVTHTDGQPINVPGILNDHLVPIAAGERIDMEFIADSTKNIYLSRIFGNRALTVFFEFEGEESQRQIETLSPTVTKVDLIKYGETQPTQFDQIKNWDLEYTMNLGGPTEHGAYTINDKTFPVDFSPLHVEEGYKVKVKISNPTNEDHPMHLHGHFFTVLSKNGERIEGSPFVKDTINVRPGEEYEIAFIADNPGNWLFHCHKLNHAAHGMVTMVKYKDYELHFIPDKNAGNAME